MMAPGPKEIPKDLGCEDAEDGQAYPGRSIWTVKTRRRQESDESQEVRESFWRGVESLKP